MTWGMVPRGARHLAIRRQVRRSSDEQKEEKGLDVSKQVGPSGEKGVAKKQYDKRYVYSTTTDDGESRIMYKHNPPDDPRAHREGEILDFSDGVDHAFKRNPFGEVAAQAKAGEVAGVRPLSIGIPGNKRRSMYGFERNNKYELTNYGQSAGYLADDGAEMDPGAAMILANARLPGFDETRESIYDKYCLRKYVEQRDLRLLERDALMHERKMKEVHDQLLIGAADDIRRVKVRDAVMQSAYKWVGLKSNETEEAYVRQGEDVLFTERIVFQYTVVFFLGLLGIIYVSSQEDGSLVVTHRCAAGELSSVSGYVEQSELIGSYKEVGEMHRYQDLVAKYVAKIDGKTESLANLRAAESFNNTEMKQW
eukprot:TRINITY_DN7469_c0_g1_i1.p1 TRINITY_DN7469_c0_g1~~TRINITY_DN7469_c0_g1_i1.p1  ORF type:complete len:366 (+),score=50.37 TRINITY_DN7469_c0_g1_i1:37-1134(+)